MHILRRKIMHSHRTLAVRSKISGKFTIQIEFLEISGNYYRDRVLKTKSEQL